MNIENYYIVILIIINVLVIYFVKIFGGKKHMEIDKELRDVLINLEYIKTSEGLKTISNGVYINIKEVGHGCINIMLSDDIGCCSNIETSNLKISDFSTIGQYKYLLRKLGNNHLNENTLTLNNNIDY